MAPGFSTPWRELTDYRLIAGLGMTLAASAGEEEAVAAAARPSS